MSMTREEAIKQIEKLKSYCEYMADSDESGAYLFDLDGQALDLAISALRPITREQMEKVRRAHWNESTHLGGFVYCSRCGYNALEANNYTFCPKCGSPFTDEAVEMVMERWEAMYGEAKAD